jgi:hypothetical protein
MASRLEWTVAKVAVMVQQRLALDWMLQGMILLLLTVVRSVSEA